MAKRNFSIYSDSGKPAKPDSAGTGLLNEVSRQARVSDRSSIQQIPAELLHANRLNESMSMADIEPLKDSIAEVGLQQPIVVARETAPDASGETMYRILSGHRRYRALCELQQEGRISYNLIPCVVKDLTQIDLPISEEAKEKYAISTTNIENRNQTFSDRIALLRMMMDVYAELKAVQSPETMNGRRAFLVKRLKLSGTQIQDLLFVDKNIVPEVRAKLDAGEMTLAAALELAHRDPEQQRAACRNDEVMPARKTAAPPQKAKEETAECSRMAMETASWRLNQIAQKLDFDRLPERKRQTYAGYMTRIQLMLAKMEKEAYRKKPARSAGTGGAQNSNSEDENGHAVK